MASGESVSIYVVQRTFRRVRRGYDPEEVDRHLQLVSEWFTRGRAGELAREVEERLEQREAAAAAVQAEARRVLEGARVEADATLEGARRRAAGELAAAERAREELLAAAREEARELAERLRAEAEQELAAYSERRRREADRLVEAARRERFGD